MLGNLLKLGAGPWGPVLEVTITVILWMVPAGAVWLYMRGEASAQYELGMAECQTTNAQAITDALTRFHVEQEGLREAALQQSAALAQNLATARANAARVSKELRAYVEANPLHPECFADPERVRLYNDARGGAGATGP